MKVIILGKGAWGTALGSVLEHNKHEVSYWDKTSRISDVDVVVISVPTQAIREVCSFIDGKSIKAIVNTSKGIEQESGLLPFQIIQEVVGKDVPYFALMGPGFSHEVLKKTPTLVNIGWLQNTFHEEITNLFQTEYFRVHGVEGVGALELAGAFKNIYAIGCGVADGIGYEINTRTLLITLAIEELYALCQALHFTIDKNALAGIVGDLVLTCNSPKSRNFTFGRLAVDSTPVESLEKIGATVEGYNSLFSIEHFIQKSGVALPFAQCISQLIYAQSRPEVQKIFLDFIRHV